MADVIAQVMRLASYYDIDIEKTFIEARRECLEIMILSVEFPCWRYCMQFSSIFYKGQIIIVINIPD